MKRIVLSILLLTLTIAFTNAANGKKFLFFKKKKAKTEQTDTIKQKTAYEKLLGKKHTSANGLMTLHQIEGKLYIELPLVLIGKDMLIGSTVTDISDNHNAVVGSKPTAPLHVRFRKHN